MALHHIQIERSAIGVLNTGNLESVNHVDASISALGGDGDAQLASALKEMTEATIHSREASEEDRAAILERLDVLATEAVAPASQRRKGAMRALAVDLANIAGGIGGLAQAWDRYGPGILAAFQ